MATVYASMVLLALILMIGPWNLLRGRPNPVCGYLRIGDAVRRHGEEPKNAMKQGRGLPARAEGGRGDIP